MLVRQREHQMSGHVAQPSGCEKAPRHDPRAPVPACCIHYLFDGANTARPPEVPRVRGLGPVSRKWSWYRVQYEDKQTGNSNETFYLEPGEGITLMTAAVGWYDGEDPQEGFNLHRRLVVARKLPREIRAERCDGDNFTL